MLQKGEEEGEAWLGRKKDKEMKACLGLKPLQKKKKK